MSDQPISAKDIKRTWPAATDRSHPFALLRAPRHLLEIEDVQFHHDSAVLLPDKPPEYEGSAPPDDQPRPRVTSLVVLARCLREAQARPNEFLLLTGHADTDGAAAYNIQLSQQRADSALFALRGERDRWQHLAARHHKVEDYQRILHWLFRDWGWPCDPGPIDNAKGPTTNDAIVAFKERFNNEFAAALPLTSEVDEATWGALFDCYMRELQEVLDVDSPEDVAYLRDQYLRFYDDQHRSLGCGENWPIENPDRPDFRSIIDRRIELSFIADEVRPPLDCHPRPGACDARHCQIYDPRFFSTEVIPVDPVPPKVQRVRVHLQLLWRDPTGADRPFPEGMEAIIEFAAGSGGSERRRLEADGKLNFFSERGRRSFTLRFEPGAGHYIATPAGGGANRLVAASEVDDLVSSGHQVYKLPPHWSMAESEWSAEGATFTAPDVALDQESIGSRAAPALLRLDPRWQYVRIEHFDRFFGHAFHGGARVAIPPVLLTGARTAPQSGDGPEDTRSNWVLRGSDGTPTCQCLPWIIQRRPDRSPDARPAQGMLLRFATAPNSFVVSKSADARAIEVITDHNRLRPSAGRLKLYDLPKVWRSRGYWARPALGQGGLFERLTQEQLDSSMDPTRPLGFSLDDLVLCRADPPGDPAAPIAWDPSRMRVAIFANTMLNGPTDGDIGPYRPDDDHGPAGMNFSYFSKQVDNLASPASSIYITDYPNWTRLVFLDGNAFEAFDRRLPDRDGVPVGARVAMCWKDAAAISAPGADPARPGPTRGGEFFTTQPFFEQRHDSWWTVDTTDDRGTGRCDLILLRCCGVDGDAERAVLLTYFRFFINFNPTFQPDFNPGAAAALGLNGATAQTWLNTALRSIPRRWTGPDGAFNVGPAMLLARDQAALPLKVRSAWFAQQQPRAISHFELGVFKPNPATADDIRAYMGSDIGVGVLGDPGAGHAPDNQAQTSGWFTSAHECGHGGSLGDEYIEGSQAKLRSYLPGFDSFSPASPFFWDTRSMMNSNMEVRPRYFWHLAEWLRALLGTSFDVAHGAYRYNLPELAGRNHVNWPKAERRDEVHGAHGKFDLTFYPLGTDDYSARVLPLAAAVAQPFDGLVVVLVRMKFDFHISDALKIDATLSNIESNIRLHMNYRFVASASVGGKRYDRCLIMFAPRYYVPGYSPNAPRGSSRHIQIDTKASGAPEWASPHKLEFPTNQSGFVFTRFFRHMCGLPDGGDATAADLQLVVRKVLPDAIVSSIP